MKPSLLPLSMGSRLLFLLYKMRIVLLLSSSLFGPRQSPFSPSLLQIHSETQLLLWSHLGILGKNCWSRHHIQRALVSIMSEVMHAPDTLLLEEHSHGRSHTNLPGGWPEQPVVTLQDRVSASPYESHLCNHRKLRAAPRTSLPLVIAKLPQDSLEGRKELRPCQIPV